MAKTFKDRRGQAGGWTGMRPGRPRGMLESRAFSEERMAQEILTLRERIPNPELRRLVASPFGDMVKFVADVERGVIGIGGQMHVDAEHHLLDEGSVQADLWGGNYYPGRAAQDCIEYTSFINIRPAQGNRGMELMDPELRDRVRALVSSLIGHGEALDDASA